MTTATMTSHPMLFERIALGELDGTAFGVSASDPRVLALRGGADDDLCERHRLRVVRAMEAARAEKQARSRFRWPVWMMPAAAVAAAAVLLVVVRVHDDVAADGDGDVAVSIGVDDLEGTRAKGEPARLIIHRDRAGVRTISDGSAHGPAQRGDQFQLAYVAGSFTQGVILSIDATGSVSLHHPESVAGGTSLTRPGEQRLDHALELDDTPGFERFIFVAARAPIDVNAVLDAARAIRHDPRAAPLSLPAGMTQSSHVIEKAKRSQ